MVLSLVLALQMAATATPAPAAPRWAVPARSASGPLDFDLARHQPAGGCAGAGAGEVLVCGRRRSAAEDFPMGHWARIFAERPIRAEMDLGGNVQGRIHAEAVPMDRGAVSNRVMVGIRMPF